MKKQQYWWFGAAAIITLIFGTMYAVTQQAQRQAANDPQIQLAEDVAMQLTAQRRPALSTGAVDMQKSLAPFVVVYDSTGKPLDGTGLLHGKLLSLPLAILKAAQGKTYAAVTLEPEDRVRIAAVTVAAPDGRYVLSGRSLKEVERRESVTLQLSALGWAASIAVLAVLFCLSRSARVIPSSLKK